MAKHASAAKEHPSGRCLSEEAGDTCGICGNCLRSPQMISMVGQGDSHVATAASATAPLAFGYRLGKANPTCSFSPWRKQREREKQRRWVWRLEGWDICGLPPPEVLGSRFAVLPSSKGVRSRVVSSVCLCSKGQRQPEPYGNSQGFPMPLMDV